MTSPLPPRRSLVQVGPTSLVDVLFDTLMTSLPKVSRMHCSDRIMTDLAIPLEVVTGHPLVWGSSEIVSPLPRADGEAWSRRVRGVV